MEEVLRHGEGEAQISRRTYKGISVSLAILFAVVGLIFLFAPNAVLLLFNSISRSFGMNQAPEQSFNFYSILAVAYMYLVTVLAYLMFMNPGEARFVWLLINAKAVSSLLSFIFFIVVGSYLICLANGIVDGMIAFGLVILLKKVRIAAE